LVINWFWIFTFQTLSRFYLIYIGHNDFFIIIGLSQLRDHWLIFPVYWSPSLRALGDHETRWMLLRKICGLKSLRLKWIRNWIIIFFLCKMLTLYDCLNYSHMRVEKYKWSPYDEHEVRKHFNRKASKSLKNRWKKKVRDTHDKEEWILDN